MIQMLCWHDSDRVVDWISSGRESLLGQGCYHTPKLILSEITLFDQYCTLVFRSFHLLTSDQFSPVQRSSQSLDK